MIQFLKELVLGLDIFAMGKVNSREKNKLRPQRHLISLLKRKVILIFSKRTHLFNSKLRLSVAMKIQYVVLEDDVRHLPLHKTS